MKCSASVELSRMLRGFKAEDAEQEEWTAEGTLAHTLADYCLKQDQADAVLFIHGEGGWEAVTPEIALAVQFYLDYVRSRPGRMLVEYKFHRPELHELYYGQTDCALYGVMSDYLEVIDYKNGKGVVVEVEHNEQLMYYANGLLHSAEFADCPDEMPVRLTIVQPNAWHSGGKLRSWDTTAGYLRRWLREELLPGMAATQAVEGWFLDMGEHCRFCPAKLVCPAFGNLAQRALGDALQLTGSETTPKYPPGWRPLINAEEAKLLSMLVNAYRKWAFAELMNGGDPATIGAKLINGKADRVWKDGAEAELAALLGEQAYERKLLSPAKVEDLPGGDKLVARWAFKPEGRPTVAPLNDKGDAATPNVGTAIFAEHLKMALASS